jgi:methionyl-tRNA formyltransferase
MTGAPPGLAAVVSHPFDLVLLGRGALLTGLAGTLRDLRDILPVRGLAAPQDVVDHFRAQEIIGPTTPVWSLDRRIDSELEALVRSLRSPLLLSVQYSWILSEAVLSHVIDRAFNMHNAKLPEYRGHHALSHVILNREPFHHATIHWMQPKVDTGFLAYERAIAIGDQDTAFDLGVKSAKAAAEILEVLLRDLAAGRAIPRTPIEGEGRFYSSKLADGLKRISDTADPELISRTARAFHYPPFEPAYYVHEGRRYHVVPGGGDEGAA